MIKVMVSKNQLDELKQITIKLKDLGDKLNQDLDSMERIHVLNQVKTLQNKTGKLMAEVVGE